MDVVAISNVNTDSFSKTQSSISQTPDDVQCPHIQPGIWKDDTLVGMEGHIPRAWTSDVGSKVGDEEIVSKDRLDHLNSGRVGNKIAEQLVNGHEVEDTNIARVWIKKL